MRLGRKGVAEISPHPPRSDIAHVKLLKTKNFISHFFLKKYLPSLWIRNLKKKKNPPFFHWQIVISTGRVLPEHAIVIAKVDFVMDLWFLGRHDFFIWRVVQKKVFELVLLILVCTMRILVFTHNKDQYWCQSKFVFCTALHWSLRMIKTNININPSFFFALPLVYKPCIYSIYIFLLFLEFLGS